MKVITEADLRVRFAKNNSPMLPLRPGECLTGPAREYAREQGIAITQAPQPNEGQWNLPLREFPDGFVDEQGVHYWEKSEHMTHLRGNLLVEKTHPRITLRGKLDSLQANIIAVQVAVAESGGQKLLDDLQEMLDHVREILSTEVRDVPFCTGRMLGYTEAELRVASHRPEFHLGHGHIMPAYQMGEALVALNLLRTHAREAELCAAQAFPGGDELKVVHALNRLSSAFYVMMCRERAGHYG